MSPPPRYTEQQRTAIAVAVLDKGMTVAAARRAAKAGELEGVDPFDMSKDAAYNCVQKARLEQAEVLAEADPRNSANTFARQVLVALTPSNQALLAQAQGGRDVDAKLRERARMMRELVALQGATEKKTQTKGRQPDHTPPTTTVDLHKLLAQDEDTQTDTPEQRDTTQAHSDAPATTGPPASLTPA